MEYGPKKCGNLKNNKKFPEEGAKNIKIFST
jgi:hypothetical protein